LGLVEILIVEEAFSRCRSGDGIVTSSCVGRKDWLFSMYTI